MRLVLPIVGMLLSGASASAHPGLAERLGFRPEDKVLILHIDDIGSVSSSIDAARDNFKFGLAKSGSLMMSAPAAGKIEAGLKSLAEVDLGIHTTLTADMRPGWSPLTPPELIQSLLDGDGHLGTSLWKLAVFGRTDEMEREMEGQIQAGLDLCRRLNHAPETCLTHIDSHMGAVFLRPSWVATYLNLARKHRLVPMIPKWAQGLKALTGFVGVPMGWLVDSLIAKIEESGFLAIDDFYIFPFPKEPVEFSARKEQYVNCLKNLKPGVTEIVLHPAYEDEEFRATMLPLAPGAGVRDHEAKFLNDPELAALILDENIHVVGFKEIQKVYPWDDVRALTP